jgi:integrase
MSRSIIRPDAALAVDDEALRDLQNRAIRDKTVRTLLEGIPAETYRAYSRDFAQFSDWCKRQSPALPALPASEVSITGYMQYLDTKVNDRYPCKPGTIERRLAGISWAHETFLNKKGTITPFASKLLHSIKSRRIKEREPGTKMAAPLLLADLRKICLHLDAKRKPLAIRNAAILVMGWACAMRRSEITALDYEDIEQLSDEGFMLVIRRSKTDQLAEGTMLPVTAEEDDLVCPLLRLKDWIEVRGTGRGPLFLRSGWKKSAKRLGDKQVQLIVTNLAKVAGAEPTGTNSTFSAHSLRAGFITDAVQAGQQDAEIMKRSRHKSHQVFMRYVRPAQTVKKNVATGFSNWGKK